MKVTDLPSPDLKNGFILPIDDEELPAHLRGTRWGGMMNLEVAERNLIDVKKVLDKYNITFSLIFGTLLGIIREGNFILYDDDVDIACFNEWSRKDHTKMKKVKEDLIKLNFHVVDSNECMLHNDFFVRDGEKIDVWWFDRINDEWIMGETVRYPVSFFDNLIEVDFLGSKFKIPNEPKKFLEKTYGPEWIIPNPKGRFRNMNPVLLKK